MKVTDVLGAATLAAALVCHGCAVLGGPELRLTRPSLLEARFEDGAGLPVTTYTPGDPGFLRVVATGFSPVASVWLETADGSRVYPVPRLADHVWRIDLAGVVGAAMATEQATTEVTFRVVAVDEKQGRTVSAPLPLTVRRTGH